MFKSLSLIVTVCLTLPLWAQRSGHRTVIGPLTDIFRKKHSARTAIPVRISIKNSTYKKFRAEIIVAKINGMPLENEFGKRVYRRTTTDDAKHLSLEVAIFKNNKYSHSIKNTFKLLKKHKGKKAITAIFSLDYARNTLKFN